MRDQDHSSSEKNVAKDDYMKGHGQVEHRTLAITKTEPLNAVDTGMPPGVPQTEGRADITPKEEDDTHAAKQALSLLDTIPSPAQEDANEEEMNVPTTKLPVLANIILPTDEEDVDAEEMNVPTTKLPVLSGIMVAPEEEDTAGEEMNVPTTKLPVLDRKGAEDQFLSQVEFQALLSTPAQFAMPDITFYEKQITWRLPGRTRASMVRTHTEPRTPTTTTQGKESYLGLIRKLIKNSGIYAIASLTSPLVTLLLAPFLTRELSRTEYGALAVLTTVVALVTGVSELGLSSAFVRAYAADAETQTHKMAVLSTYTLLMILVLLPLTLLGLIGAPWIASLVLGSTTYSRVIQVAVVLVLTQNLTNPGLTWWRVESRATLFSIISIANLLVTAGATIVLVGPFHMGIIGSLIANGLGDGIIIFCTLPLIFLRAGLRFSSSVTRSMLAFGIPNVVNVIFAWVLQLSDRYLLGHLASLALAAGYSVAYSLGGALSTAIIAPFTMAWWVLMYPMAEREDAQMLFKLIFRGFSFVMLFATLSLSLLGPWLLDLLFPTSYHAQAVIIPVIALSSMFAGILSVVNLGVSLKRKTWLASLNFIIAALVNVGINLVLIPQYGVMGAALATLVAYIVQTIIAYIISQRLYPVPFEIGLFFLALGLGIALYFGDTGLSQDQPGVLIWLIHVSSLLAYGLLLLLIGWPSLLVKSVRFLTHR